MNVKQIQEIAIPKYRECLLAQAEKLIKYLSHKVEKAARKGRDGVRVRAGVFNFWSPRRFIYNEEVRKIVLEYFVELGFEMEEHRNPMARSWDSFRVNGIGISWRPDNLTEDCVVCTEDNRLKHLVLTGKAPRVIDEKDS